MKFNRFTLVMAAFPFVLYACGSDDSGGGGGTGGKKDAGADTGKGGTGGVGAVGGTGGAGLTGGTGGAVGGAGGTAGTATGGTAGAAGSATGGTAGAAGSASGGTAGVAGSASGGTAGVAGSASGGTAGVGPDASVGGSAGAAGSGGTAGTDGGTPATGDTCASPYVVGSVPFLTSGSTVGATSDYGYGANACPPQTGSAGSAAPDRVYAFTPTVAGKYLVQLHSATGFDSVLYVATDCANINTTCLAGDDIVCSDCTEAVTIDATAGTTYYIFVDGWQNSGTPTGGDYMLQVDAVTAPTNDTCANATPITTVPYYQVGDTSTTTADYGFAANSCPGVSGAKGAGTKDVVYAFTPATSGTYILDVGTLDWDAAIYVATDCSMIDATCVGAADSCADYCTETRSFAATAGTTYYIFVDGYQTSSSPNEAGIFTIGLSEAPPPPPGDTCATALPVTALPFTDSGNTSGATSDYGYSTGSCPPETGGWGSGSADIVYSFNPTVTGSYTISLGGNLDSTVYVVTNCADVNNSCVAGDEHCGGGGGCTESVTTNLTAGTTYYIIVDGYGTSSNIAGPYQLDIIKNP